ncbi:hypothetical protein [Streptomyces peucetius]|uniref:Uncharacterized protein n=1 Tax=Streptomyces peucetius TaxID=1950 RepID=A0ABY6IEL5_STRPE|nr:hypothetical protein [Streptomyces peucetius]UYQ64165.1 hypothetical protein OGH68_23655 [Streptomyces peucetius]
MVRVRTRTHARLADAITQQTASVCAGSVCVLASGHEGPHHDRAGDAWWVTPEIADAVTVSFLAHVPADAFGRPAGEETNR